MDLRELKKAIQEVAYAVRKGDKSKFDLLKELRRQHRAACGISEPEPKGKINPPDPVLPVIDDLESTKDHITEPEKRSKKQKRSKED